MAISIRRGRWAFSARWSSRKRLYAFVAAVDITSDEPPFPTIARNFELGLGHAIVSLMVPRSYESRFKLYPRRKEGV